MSECTTPGCLPDRVGTCYLFDHLGRICPFCTQHGSELRGVHERITALLVRIDGLKTLLAALTTGETPPRLAVELRATMKDQAEVLIILIKRERELTGATEVGK